MEATKKLIGMAVLGSLMMSGCGAVEKIKERCDGNGDGSATCRFGLAVKAHSGPITSADLNAFDAAQVVGDLSKGNVAALSATSTATVSLKDNGIVYASNTFTLTRYGTELRAANPTLVNNWLRANALNADSITLDVDGIRVGEVTGTNLFTMVVEYLGSEVTGVTYSWYRPGSDSVGYTDEK